MTRTKNARVIQVIVVDEALGEEKGRIIQHLYTTEGKHICTIGAPSVEKKK